MEAPLEPAKYPSNCLNHNIMTNDDLKEDLGDMSFCMSQYAKEALKMIFMMRSHHMLTDVILEVGKELFHAHKVMLSAASPYFKAMFTGGLKESEMSRVTLQGVREKCFILDFLIVTDCLFYFKRFVQLQWPE